MDANISTSTLTDSNNRNGNVSSSSNISGVNLITKSIKLAVTDCSINLFFHDITINPDFYLFTN